MPYIKGIKLIRPLDYVLYNKKEAFKLLVEKFKYQEYPQKHFESRFTRFYEGYWLPKRFGYDTRKIQFSSLILTGQMSREDAINKLKNPSYDKENINNEIEYIANKLDIDVEELILYFNIPQKTYKDYKSQKFIYNIGSKILKFIGIEKGGKR